MKSGIGLCGLAAAVLLATTALTTAEASPYMPAKQSASAVEPAAGFQCGPNKHWSKNLGRCARNKTSISGYRRIR